MEAEDGDASAPGRAAAPAPGAAPGQSAERAAAAEPAAGEPAGTAERLAGDSVDGDDNGGGDRELGDHSDDGPDGTAGAEPLAAADGVQPGRERRPDVSGGIGCTALLLPLLAVAGAVLCFFAGVLSTATGCAPNGSALCSPNGPWYAFALPVFVSPLAAAVAAIGAVTVRRHRSTWLAVGYAIVFISIIVGLATASTGSS